MYISNSGNNISRYLDHKNKSVEPDVRGNTNGVFHSKRSNNDEKTNAIPPGSKWLYVYLQLPIIDNNPRLSKYVNLVLCTGLILHSVRK